MARGCRKPGWYRALLHGSHSTPAGVAGNVLRAVLRAVLPGVEAPASEPVAVVVAAVVAPVVVGAVMLGPPGRDPDDPQAARAATAVTARPRRASAVDRVRVVPRTEPQLGWVTFRRATGS